MAEGAIVLLVMVVIVGGLALVLGPRLLAEHRRYVENLEAAAQRYGGRYTAEQRLELTVDGVPVRLEWNLGAGARKDGVRTFGVTELFVDEAPGGLELEVTPKVAYDGGLLGTNGSVSTGDVAFDAALAVDGAPEDRVRAALDEETRRRLLALRALGVAPGAPAVMRLEVTGAKLHLRCDRDLVHEREHLLAFLEQGLALWRRLRTA